MSCVAAFKSPFGISFLMKKLNLKLKIKKKWVFPFYGKEVLCNIMYTTFSRNEL